jgi:hypothetical protein
MHVVLRATISKRDCHSGGSGPVQLASLSPAAVSGLHSQSKGVSDIDFYEDSDSLLETPVSDTDCGSSETMTNPVQSNHLQPFSGHSPAGNRPNQTPGRLVDVQRPNPTRAATPACDPTALIATSNHAFQSSEHFNESCALYRALRRGCRHDRRTTRSRGPYRGRWANVNAAEGEAGMAAVIPSAHPSMELVQSKKRLHSCGLSTNSTCPRERRAGCAELGRRQSGTSWRFPPTTTVLVSVADRAAKGGGRNWKGNVANEEQELHNGSAGGSAYVVESDNAPRATWNLDLAESTASKRALEMLAVHPVALAEATDRMHAFVVVEACNMHTPDTVEATGEVHTSATDEGKGSIRCPPMDVGDASQQLADWYPEMCSPASQCGATTANVHPPSSTHCLLGGGRHSCSAPLELLGSDSTLTRQGTALQEAIGDARAGGQADVCEHDSLPRGTAPVVTGPPMLRGSFLRADTRARLQLLCMQHRAAKHPRPQPADAVGSEPLLNTVKCAPSSQPSQPSKQPTRTVPSSGSGSPQRVGKSTGMHASPQVPWYGGGCLRRGVRGTLWRDSVARHAQGPLSNHQA